MKSEIPFFIVGSGRSGTTLLRLMLDQHPRLCVPPESHFIPEFYDLQPERPDAEWFVTQLSQHERFTEWNLPIEEVRSRITSSTPDWSHLFHAAFSAYAASQEKPRYGDKTPGYAARLDTLRTIFGKLKIIHIVRDVHSVVASLKRMPWFRYGIIEATRMWKRQVSEGRRSGLAMGPDIYLEIRYESFVLDPEDTLRGICRHLGEEYDPAMLDYHQHSHEHLPRHDLSWNQKTSKPVTTDAVDRWREELNDREVGLIDWFAGPLAEELGYSSGRHLSVGSWPAIAAWGYHGSRRRVGKWIPLLQPRTKGPRRLSELKDE